MPYTIKGKGDLRQVFDGKTLIGTLERFEQTETTANINFVSGSASFRKHTIVRWRAKFPDGSRVRWSDGRLRVLRAMKEAKEPTVWTRYPPLSLSAQEAP